jgi:hypothetical protein
MANEREYDGNYTKYMEMMVGRSIKKWRNLTRKWGEGQKEIVNAAREVPLEERSDRAWKLYNLADTIKDEKNRAFMQWGSMIWNLPDETLDNIIESFKF